MSRPLARLLLFPCLLLTAASGARADAVTYAIDPVHTRVLFAIDHAGFSKALGTVSGSHGTLWFDPDDWTSARVEVQVPLARLDLGDDKWNRATLARNLLDAEAHPLVTFVSTRIEPVDARQAIVHGTLTLRGVSREVALAVTLNAARRHPMPPFRRTVGFSATTLLKRSDFGIAAWPSVIGDEVELRIEAEATRTRASAAGDGVDEAGPRPDPELEPPQPVTIPDPPEDTEPVP